MNFFRKVFIKTLTSGLDLPSISQTWLSVLLLFIGYFLTASKDLYWFDSSELALAGLQNGLSHPPGQPLYTLILHFGVMLGLPPLLWMNTVSCIFGALCLIPLTSIFHTTVGKKWVKDNFMVTISIILLFSSGFLPQLWESSTRIEVYSVAGFFCLYQLALLIPVLKDEKEAGSRFWFFHGLIAGITASINPVMIMAIEISSFFAFFPLWIRKRKKISLNTLKNTGLTLSGICIGLLPYLHIWVVSNAHDRFVWGAPSNFHSFIFYITGKDYSHNLHAGFTGMIKHIGVFAVWNWKRGVGIIGLLGILGWIFCLRKLEFYILFTGSFFLLLSWVCLNEPYFPEIPDFYNYLFPAYWLLLAGAISVILLLLREVRGKFMDKTLFPLVCVVWFIGIVLLPPSLPERSRSKNRAPRIIAKSILDEAPPGAIILVSSDHLFFPLFYLTEGERVRQDVVLIASGLASSSWYWELILRRHKDLNKFNVYVSDRWERINRFLIANSDRPLLAENYFLGQLSEKMLCMGGWMVWSEELCSESDSRAREEKRMKALDTLRRLSFTFGNRWTIDERVFSFIGLSWGHDERRTGQLRGAVMSYLAGAGFRWEGILPVIQDKLIEKPLPQTKISLLSTPSRNLFFVADILSFFDKNISNRTLKLSERLKY